MKAVVIDPWHVQFLLQRDYQGIVMLDDIYLNSNMDALWASLGGPGLCKYDLTDWGHTIAGTGMLDFGCKVSFTV